MTLRQFKVVVETHPEGYAAYPLGLKGVVVGEGDAPAEARADVRSAIHFHIGTFGREVIEAESPCSMPSSRKPASRISAEVSCRRPQGARRQDA